MERLYELLHETSRATGRAGILKADLQLPGDRETMTIDHAASPPVCEGRSLAWRLGAVDHGRDRHRADRVGAVGRLREGVGDGFFGDAATYYTLGHSLADDLDFEYRREDLVRVWQEFPSGPEGHLPQARQRRTRTFYYAQGRTSIRWSPRRSSGCSAPTASWCCTRC